MIQGPYTIEDNQKREDRTELIDGNIFKMKLYLPIYAQVLRALYVMMATHIGSEKTGAKIYQFVGVQLDKDEKTCMVPDLCVVIDSQKLEGGKFVVGAPEMIVEILGSDVEDRRRDLTVKVEKYAAAGVREYWILDPEHERMMVYDFTKEVPTLPEIHSFAEEVPVKVFKDLLNDEWAVSFPELQNKVQKFFEVQKLTKEVRERRKQKEEMTQGA
jgi:Uma2 family endonuclease